MYDSLQLSPQTFQGDLLRLSLDPQSAQYGLDFFSLEEYKLLDYNISQTFCLMMGKRKERIKLEENLKKNPPKIYGKPINIVSQESYLGEQLELSL